jgi:hypothetical protein
MTDQNSLHISLAQSLLTKIGGNVGHDIYSSIFEFIDNSIDAGSTNIGIGITTDLDSNDKKTDDILYYYDNGIGINEPLRLLGGNGTEGKKYAIGKKHTGFNDSIINLTDCNTVLTIYANHCNNLVMLRLDMRKMYHAWHNMKHDTECTGIDFGKCQQLLMNGYTPVRDSDMVLIYANKLVDKVPDMKTWLEYNSGIFITLTINNNENTHNDRINLIREFIEQPRIEEYLNMYYSIKLNLKLNNRQICMLPNNNITKSDIYKPIIYSLFKSTSCNDDIIIKRNDGVIRYIKKIDNKTLNLQYKLHEISDDINNTLENPLLPFAKIEITCISDDDSKNQKEILSIRNSIGIEELRGFYIKYKTKMIGLAALPTPRYITQRNFRNVRIIMDIGDNEPFGMMDDITMTNKTNLMFNKTSPIYLWLFTNIIKEEVVKYLDYTRKTQNERIYDAGCIDLPKYIKEIITPTPIPPLIPIIPIPIVTMLGSSSGRKPKPQTCIEPKPLPLEPLPSQPMPLQAKVRIQNNNLVISDVNLDDIIIRRETIHIQNLEKFIRLLTEDPLMKHNIKSILNKMDLSFNTN